MFVINLITHERSPAKAAFRPDPDGLSVYSWWAVQELELELGDLLQRRQNVLIRLAIDEVRRIDGVDVVGDPWPRDVLDPDHRRNGAHALIKGVETTLPRGVWRERRDALLQLACEIVKPPPSDA